MSTFTKLLLLLMLLPKPATAMMCLAWFNDAELVKEKVSKADIVIARNELNATKVLTYL